MGYLLIVLVLSAPLCGASGWLISRALSHTPRGVLLVLSPLVFVLAGKLLATQEAFEFRQGCEGECERNAFLVVVVALGWIGFVIGVVLGWMRAAHDRRIRDDRGRFSLRNAK